MPRNETFLSQSRVLENGTSSAFNAWQYPSADGDENDYTMTVQALDSSGNPGPCFLTPVPRPIVLNSPICFSSRAAVSHQDVAGTATTTYQTSPYKFITLEDKSCTPMSTMEWADDPKDGRQQQTVWFNTTTAGEPDLPPKPTGCHSASDAAPHPAARVLAAVAGFLF